MKRLVIIDGNSIMNRAFYGIMSSKMLMTDDGTYTNAVYGFLAIMFKIIDDLNPDYMAVAFDLKAPTARHKAYDGYKANRKGMPNELAVQMPIIKEILNSMNITVIEKEGYEADDILGTLSVKGEKEGIDVTILSGDRDTFQLATNKVTIRIPRTKMGKTEIEDFNQDKIEEIYGIEPKQLIEVKALQGDSSDNIPGVPGIGEKTALSIIQKYQTVENLYDKLDKNETELKGKVKENLEKNKDLAVMSKFLGTINLEVPLDVNIEELKLKEWNQQKTFDIFKKLKFNRYIERFNLKGTNSEEKTPENNLFEIEEVNLNLIKDILKQNKKLFYYLVTKNSQNDNIIDKSIEYISIYNENKVYYIKIDENNIMDLKELFEDSNIEKYGYKTSENYILFKQMGINLNNLVYDAEIAMYDIDPTDSKHSLEDAASKYLNIDISQYIKQLGIREKDQQINLFEQNENESDKYDETLACIYAYIIYRLSVITLESLEKDNELKLFKNIEMPLVEVLAEMQYNGMYVDKKELELFGKELKEKIENLKNEIYELSGEEFNINSPKQLGELLFEKLKLPVYKKTKSGYSTDVDVLEKLRLAHPIIEKILEYRTLAKLNSTYVEGLIQYINKKTKRIHSYFHQTITATGRISSTEPNLQNIPTRIELGKRLRKVFKPKSGFVFIDADYSQIELRVLAHISEDENMIQAFLNNEDIHKQAASKVFNVPIEEVTKEQRSQAKAVNFGIVYGISDFGLAEQLGVSRKLAKTYIEQYLEKYKGIQKFMNNIVEKAKEQGYVETLFNRRRYIPELKSNSYVVRQFGARVAMNTPIQGTAADIMKIAMITAYNKLKNRKLESKIVLQVHDELLIEAKIEEKEEVEKILKESMEGAIKLKVPLIAETSIADNWYDAK